MIASQGSPRESSNASSNASANVPSNVSLTRRSIRTRLTLWYTAALGILLVITGSLTYAVLKRVTRADSDAYLTDTADAVASSLQLALASVPKAWASDSLAPRWAADRTLENHRFRDIGVAIFQSRPGGVDGPRLHLLAWIRPRARRAISVARPAGNGRAPRRCGRWP